MRRFKSGLYKISLTLAKSAKDEATADIQFNGGIVAGHGDSKTFGSFNIAGTFVSEAPYSLSLSVKLNTGGEVKLEGFHSSGGTMFGSCSGDYGGGNFDITPLSETELFKLKAARVEGDMKQLQAMGFSKELCEKALNKTSTVEEALDWLMNNAQQEFEIPNDHHVQQESSAPSAEQVQQLVDMGFDREIAMNALALCNNNFQEAIDWIVQNM
jgi:polyhydroxyalkanoate synthesis regulator phasin